MMTDFVGIIWKESYRQGLFFLLKAWVLKSSWQTVKWVGLNPLPPPLTPVDMWVPSYLSIECPPTFLQEKRIFHSNRCQHLTGMLPAVNVYILSFQELPSQVIILADCVCLMAVGCVVAVGDGGGQDCSPVLSGVSDWYLGLSSLSPSRHGGLWHSVASPVPSPHSVPPAVSTDNITSADSAPQHSNTTTPDRQHSRECRHRQT